MPITFELFCWVTSITFAVLIALLIPILTQVMGLRGDLKPITSLVNDVNTFLRTRKLADIFEARKGESKIEQKSLSPEKAAERDALVAIGREHGLLPHEAVRLRELLEEDARDELARGLLGLLAFAGIMLIIGAIISRLSQESR